MATQGEIRCSSHRAVPHPAISQALPPQALARERAFSPHRASSLRRTETILLFLLAFYW